MPRKTGPACWHKSQEPLYLVEIDFDAASAAWKANKISIGNGEYKYKPEKKTKKRKRKR
jgi:hypothetical protein